MNHFNENCGKTVPFLCQKPRGGVAQKGPVDQNPAKTLPKKGVGSDSGKFCLMEPFSSQCPCGSTSPEQRELVWSLSKQLGAIPGIKAVALAGSYARGRAQPGSDIDLGIFYSEAAPFSFQSIRELAEAVNDTAGPVVTDFYGWGPWVNGGAWLTIRGQRVDFIYRNLEQVERVITEAQAGRYEVHYLQQPPFGFFSATYLGEIAVCIPLFDPEARLDVLKRRVADYPEALRRSVVQDYLFMAEFTLTAFAPKVAARSDTYGTAACLTRAVNELVLVLFALNRKYPINDKTALAEVAEFEGAPREFGSRVQKTLAHLGSSATELLAAVESIAQLVRETVELTNGLYQPRYTLPN
jgi:predicted nucleotidyltransferase